jgi:hypothetical protein
VSEVAAAKGMILANMKTPPSCSTLSSAVQAK